MFGNKNNKEKDNLQQYRDLASIGRYDLIPADIQMKLACEELERSKMELNEQKREIQANYKKLKENSKILSQLAYGQNQEGYGRR